MRALLLATLLAAVCTVPAVARDTALKIALQSVLDLPEAKEQLDGSVRFCLAGSETPRIEERLGDGVGKDKTNSVGRSTERTCLLATLSALVTLQDKAKQKGANAVVGIVSYYNSEVSTNPVDIECHTGVIVVNVAVKGYFVKVAP